MTSSISLVDAAVRGDEVRRGRVERRAVHAGDAAAGLLDDQRAGGDVPRLEVLLPEAVEPARGDVAEVERGRPQPPHRARPPRNAPNSSTRSRVCLCTS